MPQIQQKDNYLKTFRLNGKSIWFEDVLSGKVDLKDKSEFEKTSLNFIKDWLSGKEIYSVKTSGSTGIPKVIKFTRAQMKKSAIRTIKQFYLKPGQTVLSCLDTKFVAGLMMLVRAIEGKLNLVIIDPTNLFEEIENVGNINFCALTPYQCESMLNVTPWAFSNIQTLLIGGASLHPGLDKKMQYVGIEIFQSYAMTETLTHVALRKVSGDDTSEVYRAMGGVTFSQDKKGCLIVHDRVLGIDGLITNDLVTLVDERSFKWIGRIDHVINTGGIKIHIEELEQEIGMILSNHGVYQSFCIVSVPDQKFTNKLILFIEDPVNQLDKTEVLELLRSNLPKYHNPKEIKIVSELLLTRTGKIDRIGNEKLFLNDLNKDKK